MTIVRPSLRIGCVNHVFLATIVYEKEEINDHSSSILIENSHKRNLFIH